MIFKTLRKLFASANEVEDIEKTETEDVEAESVDDDSEPHLDEDSLDLPEIDLSPESQKIIDEIAESSNEANPEEDEVEYVTEATPKPPVVAFFSPIKREQFEKDMKKMVGTIYELGRGDLNTAVNNAVANILGGNFTAVVVEDEQTDAKVQEVLDMYPNMVVVEEYIPKRATKESAGYDFKALFDMTLHPGIQYLIPTGFKSFIMPGWFLALYPRSSLGLKYGMRLNNTTGIIDGDYYENEDNDGHILISLTINKKLDIKKGDSICQGIFMPYGITFTDIEYSPEEVRKGGWGSTDEKENNDG